MHPLVEAKGLPTYKLLLQVLGDFCSQWPMTGVDRLLDAALEDGRKIMPADKRALSILDTVLVNDSIAAAVQDLQNKRFSDLSVNVRPCYKDGRKIRVAFWVRDKQFVSDKVRDLMDFNGKGKSGKWCDQDGKPVTLIDIERETE